MKKQYSKPAIRFENFVLNDYIAACSTSIGQITYGGDAGECPVPPGIGYDYDDWLSRGIFDAPCAQDGFGQDVTDDRYNGDYCYHNPSGNLVIYGS